MPFADEGKTEQNRKERKMALYRRGKWWWMSIWRGGRHIQKSTCIADKRTARAVEQAMKLAGEAVDGAGRRLLCPVKNDEGRKRKIVRGLLEAIYGDDSDRARLDSVWAEYEEVVKTRGKRTAERTLREKRGDFACFVKWAASRNVVSLDEVTAVVARQYSAELADRVSDKRRSNVICGISSVWNAVLSAHPGIANPWPQAAPVIDAKRTTRTGFSEEEERLVFAAAREIHPQWLLACMVGRHTGLRYGDVCRLTWGQVDFGRRTVSVTPSKTAHSSGVSLRIPISVPLLSALADWRAKRPADTPHDRVLPWLVERSPDGDRRFRAVLEKAGLDPAHFSFHSWRHTLATRMGAAGVDIEVRKRILGHVTDAMAERYNHADLTERMRDGIDAAS